MNKNRTEQMESEPKRKNGVIYSIIALNPDFKQDETYYGSTFQSLSKRFFEHKNNYKRWRDQKYCFVSSFLLFEKYGVDACRIVMVEELQNVNRNERERKEYQYISNNPCCNRMGKSGIEPRLGTIEYGKQHYQLNKDSISVQHAQYYEEHKNSILDQHAQYRQENKDKISDLQSRYYQEHKDEILKQHARYRQENKNKISHQQALPFTCQCGSICRISDKSRHLKSMKHLDWEKSQNE